MSQPSVTAFFNSRKRQANDEIRNKSKVRVLEKSSTRNSEKNEPDEQNLTPVVENLDTEIPSPKVVYTAAATRLASVVRSIQFDSSKSSSSVKMTPKASARARASRNKKSTSQDGQTDIRETFLKIDPAGGCGVPKIVPFEKMGPLSPRKNNYVRSSEVADGETKTEAPAAGSLTPKKSSLVADRISRQDPSLAEIKRRIDQSSRLRELRASIARFKKCEEKIERLENNEKRRESDKPRIRKFESIRLEIPVSPSKTVRSPSDSFLSPTKSIELSASASPQRRLLFAPKEQPSSPVKSSPTKIPAYQRYRTLVDGGTPALPLPYDYRFLAEAFRCVDTVAAMLFNRKEVITFKKLKPAVQELLRRNFTLRHLAQIKTIYPEAFTYAQEKLRNFGSATKQDKYELVLTPAVLEKDGRNTPDPDNVLKSAAEMSMGPEVMLDRRRKFYNVLLHKVKTEHENFLLSLESPINIPKDKINRWHPEFDVETCRPIELADLPEAPNVEKAHSAKEVLEKAKSLFNCNTRMEKALQRLADSKMTSKTSIDDSTTVMTEIADSANETRKVEISVVDTPPATPTTQTSHFNSAFKGIPKALLERVRAKQAAKALEAMTRTPTADREAALYSRLPEMAKILRNIFVVEKKSVLPLETVITKLDNSFKTKLTPNELEEHVRLVCKLLPTFVCLQKVRQIDYLKLAKTADIVKVVKRLELIANDKVTV